MVEKVTNHKEKQRNIIIVQGKRPESNRRCQKRKLYGNIRETSKLNGSVDREGSIKEGAILLH